MNAKDIIRRGTQPVRQVTAAGWRGLTEEVIATVQRIPVRSRDELRTQFPGRTPDEIADVLIRDAARASAGVGAAVGGWAALPNVTVIPAGVVAETLAVIGIEVKLVAELHEVYGVGTVGPAGRRMLTYLAAWAERRSAVLLPGSLALTVGGPLRKRLSRRVARRAGRSSTSLAPLLVGAVAGAAFNLRETLRVGKEVRGSILNDPLSLRTWD